ncbi:MAG: CDP-diacylglycerol--serine O-phosphatidyltransferase [Myxococcales bacterium]|nr:CDP-diacylglycerol--serine O-phosphatidyltransferase [Myxococcales bacterium]
MRVNLRKSLFILPNLFTVSSIFCGFYAAVLCIGTASQEDHYKAALLILYAMFFDTIDGRVARLTRTQSSFGVQLDSLADVVSFGVAPALLVYSWALQPLGIVGVGACFAFVACGAIRLGRFNVLAMADDGAPKKPGRYILGLPIPGAAGILVSLVAANHAVSGGLPSSPVPILVVVISLSLFMVSTIKFRSFKDLTMNWRTVLLVAFAIGSSTVLALKLHMAFALGWLLTSYVAIGLVESIIGLSRKAVRRGRDSENEAG